MQIYLIGSLRNPQIPHIANQLRQAGHNVFDDWFAAGPEADDKWRDYEQTRGRTYLDALTGLAAEHVFRFDYTHLNRSEAAILVLPGGKSAHLEFGYIIGQGKPGFILLDAPERWDVMYKFATGVFITLEGVIDALDHTSPIDGSRFNRPRRCKRLVDWARVLWDWTCRRRRWGRLAGYYLRRAPIHHSG